MHAAGFYCHGDATEIFAFDVSEFSIMLKYQYVIQYTKQYAAMHSVITLSCAAFTVMPNICMLLISLNYVEMSICNTIH